MGFFVLIFLVGYLALAWILTKLLYRKLSRPFLRRGLAGLTFTILALVPFTEIIVENIAVIYLCDQQGGEHYLEKPKPEYGYSPQTRGGVKYGCEDSCVELLLRKEYPFIELESDQNYTYALPVEAGIYRYYLSTYGDENCSLYYEALSKAKLTFADMLTSSGYCLAAKKVPQITAEISHKRRQRIIEFPFGSVSNYTKYLVQNNKTVLVKHEWFSPTSFVTNWLFPFLEVNACEEDFYGYRKFRPNTHWNN